MQLTEDVTPRTHSHRHRRADTGQKYAYKDSPFSLVPHSCLCSPIFLTLFASFLNPWACARCDLSTQPSFDSPSNFASHPWSFPAPQQSAHVSLSSETVYLSVGGSLLGVENLLERISLSRSTTCSLGDPRSGRA